MLRLLGYLCLGLGLLALWADVTGRTEGGAAFASIAARWFQLHPTSLIGLQSGLENRVHPDAFFSYVLPVLELPAAGTAAVLGAVMLLVARWRG